MKKIDKNTLDKINPVLLEKIDLYLYYTIIKGKKVYDIDSIREYTDYLIKDLEIRNKEK